MTRTQHTLQGRQLRALLIDLNGTLHVGNTLTSGAVPAIERLRAARIPFVFCSNSTKESEVRLLARLDKMGLSATQADLLTSLGACRTLVEQRGLSPFLLLSSEAAEEFASAPSGPPDAVVLGLHPPAFSYDNLNTAFRILKREPLPSTAGATAEPASDRQPVLIAPHTAPFHQAPDTSEAPAGLSLGIGAYVRALEAASGVEAEVVGKPTRTFFELAIARCEDVYGVKLAPHEVGIVGDDVVNDLGAGAQELGLVRILVKTGKYRPGVEEKGTPPDAVFDSFADLVDALLDA